MNGGRVALGLLLCAAPAAARGDGELRLTMADGRERSYYLHVPPSYDGKSPVPLVIVLHGGGGSALGAIRMSDMDARADEKGFLVAYPNGSGRFGERLRTWNAWNCCGWAQKAGIDDVGFIRALIDKLGREYRVDRRRVYAAGLSNGAMMSYRLACELADAIAAVAPVAGAVNTDACRPSEPVSVIAFHGTADEHVLYGGGVNRKRWPGSEPRSDRSVAHSVGTWVKADDCAGKPRRETIGHVRKDAYSDCRAGAEVVLYSVEGQGHAWPGGAPGLGNGNLDEPTREISATGLMVDFFLAHPKP